MLATRNRILSPISIALLAAASLFLCIGLQAQTTNAALSGIVADPSGAHIAKAKVVLVNQNSKDTRSTTTNTGGIYNFAGLSSGTYTLTITFPGFKTYVEDDIALHPGDTSELPTITMGIGEESVTIEVSAHEELATNGEVSSLITADDIKHLATEGRDVTELVKTLPGFALQPGATTSGGGLANSAPDFEVVGPGGALGYYSANGAPANGISLISDGANIQDPGTAGATTQIINMDMVQEVKVSTSNFGADTAKGPVVINAVGKSGGQPFHGSLYVIGRTYQLNAQDWLLKNQGQIKPHDHFLYPGFTIGGPILIPGTNFNHAKKFLFLVGAEDSAQRNNLLGGSSTSALHLSTVPTDAMRNGDFSTASLENLFNVTPGVLAQKCIPGQSLYIFYNFCQTPGNVDTPNGNQIMGGVFPAADIDPGAQAYLKSVFPHQNRIAQPVPGLNGAVAQESDGFDRSDLYLTNHDLYQIRGRVDYNPTQNSKFYTVYSVEEGDYFSPFTEYGSVSFASGVLHDPSLIRSNQNSQSASANFVHIFGPTLTSETFAAATYFFQNFNPNNEALQTVAALGYPYLSPLNNGTKQIPQLGYSSNAGVPLFPEPDFSFGQGYSRKISLNAGDNVTKVWKKHTIKVGFYYERVSNNQLSLGSATQGSIAEYGNYATFRHPNDLGGMNPVNPNNSIVNFLFGNVNYFAQSDLTKPEDLFYNAIEGYATDSYKITRRLTLDFGVRFDHLGPWTDPRGVGPAYWFPQAYLTSSVVTQGYPSGTTPAAGIPRNQLPGLDWHGKNSSISDAAEQARWAFVSPRVGFAYDVYGGGRTVLTGGMGFYRTHDSWGDYVGALSTSLGGLTTSYTNTTLFCLDAIARNTAAQNLACTGGKAGGTPPTATVSGLSYAASDSPSFTAVDPNDNQQALTLNYSLGVNQAFRRFGNVIINYVGNHGSDLILTNGNNVNLIKQGGLFAPDPNPMSPGYGVITPTTDNIGANGTLVDDYRPYPFYDGIYLLRHVLSSNYNALQTTWSKYSGHMHYNFNYTWSKALVDRGAPGNGGVSDPTNSRKDYDIASFDRTHLFNASYTYVEGRVVRAHGLLGGFANYWEISGITNIQSGPNIAAAYGTNFQLSTAGSTTPTDSQTYLGTPDILLQPITTCNITANLQKNQFINSACLTLGPVGVNGPSHYPYARGPHFFNSDLSLQKGFQLGERKELQFRFSAFNFMNHPLTSLVAATSSPLHLVIAGPGAAANQTFGVSDYKQGRRVAEVTARFNF